MKQYLKLMGTVVCRTPAFSPDDQLDQRWDELKKMIYEASEEFHALIDKIDPSQLANTNEKIRFSIWKYFNRARFRSTPFGSFAGVSYVPIADIDDPLILNDELIKHAFTDWSYKVMRPGKAPEWLLTNATYYLVGEDIRYIRFTGETFELATIAAMAEITVLLKLCHIQTKPGDIYAMMENRFDMPQESTSELLEQLFAVQLLFSDLDPNITGPDHFERLQLTGKRSKYIIAERELNGGGLDVSALRTVPEYFDFLKGFLLQTTNNDLDTFRKDFNRRFDLRAIPLSKALDPETGIGYGGLAMEPEDESLMAIFSQGQQDKQQNLSFSNSPQHHFLLNCLLNGGAIHLENYKEKTAVSAHHFPNTLSAMFTIHKGQAIIETSGNCTANTLIGRFTLAGGEALKLAKNIAEVERSANPDILFFEVAYQAEKRVDNVNRRQQLYENELPLLSWSCFKEPLLMDDLLVMVRGNEIILWSKKYNKRAVPRIASAYNYNRSDLSVYRFLCDLQHQNLCVDLTFRFRQFLPALGHYPRVYYKDLIVSAEMWKYDTAITNLAGLKKWLSEKQIIASFKCGNSDQTLSFDPNNNDDLNAFLIYTRQNTTGDIYITEALHGDTVRGLNGGRYIPQYIGSFYHHEPVYAAHNPPAPQATEQDFHPGNEWLYLEIYCRPVRSNGVLQHIRRYVFENRQHVKKWFFIRYSDPAPHIRFRLQLKDPLTMGLIMAGINEALAELISTGLISDIQVKTYTRESERYGANRMEIVETHFYRDSQYISKLLKRNISVRQLQLLTLQLMYKWVQLSNLRSSETFVQTVAASFAEEFKLEQPAFKQLNKAFELLRKDLVSSRLNLAEVYYAAFTKVILDCHNETERERILADLIHMHVNRVFSTAQRKHEAVLYQYLLKWLKIMQFREAAVQAH